MVTILALSGSLRAESSNSRLLELVASLAPADVGVVLFRGIDQLPHFNPDIDREEDTPATSVAAWREAVRSADGIVISCPEYAHGVPGSFKNALDWLVSSADMLGKPVIFLNASPSGGEFAQPSLAETLRLIGGNVLEEHSRLAPFLPPAIWRDGPDEATLGALRRSVGGLVAVILSA